MKFMLREFARKIREHLKTAKHTPELTKHLEKLAADAYAVSNMPGWDDQENRTKRARLGRRQPTCLLILQCPCSQKRK
jgi:hypothetical protein